MAPIEYTNFSILKPTYTFEEAIEVMKIRDRQVTNINKKLIWKDVRTGKKVNFGYIER